MKFPRFHGIELALGSFIRNFRLENVSNNSEILTMQGRVWLDSDTKEIKYAISDGKGGFSVRVLCKYTGRESKIDIGWKDLPSSISVTSESSNSPKLKTVVGGIKQYSFEGNHLNEAFLTFHVNHDYMLNTPLFPHVHFSPSSNNTGVVRFGFEYSLAKGYSRGIPFQMTDTVYLEQPVSGMCNDHQIVEASLQQFLLSADIEPDTIIMSRLFRDGKHPNDTYPDDIFVYYCDLHYLSDSLSTLNKNPNFYV